MTDSQPSRRPSTIAEEKVDEARDVGATEPSSRICRKNKVSPNGTIISKKFPQLKTKKK